MKYRTEVDMLGTINIANYLYYGIQTERALQSFQISNSKISEYPKTIRELILEKELLTETELDTILSNENLMHPQYRAQLRE